MAFFRNFKKSFEELKSIRCLTVTALLIGVSVALKFVMIMPSETLKISSVSYTHLTLPTICSV